MGMAFGYALIAGLAMPCDTYFTVVGVGLPKSYQSLYVAIFVDLSLLNSNANT